MNENLLCIVDYFSKVSNVIIIYDNNYIECDNNIKDNVIKCLVDISNDAYEMPSLGVSLDSETRLATTKGLWLELFYETTYFHNDMPFDRLLIEVKEDYTGCSIIRCYAGKYEGRCYYIDLQQSMKPLYDNLLNITKMTNI